MEGRQFVSTTTSVALAASITVWFEGSHGGLDVAGGECTLVFADGAGEGQVRVELQKRRTDRMAADNGRLLK